MWEKWRKHLSIIISIVILLILMILTVGSQFHSSLAMFSDKVFHPIQVVFQKIDEVSLNVINNVKDFRNLQHERDQLELELADLRRIAVENEELKREKDVLLQSLDYKQNNPESEVVFSRIIMRDPSNWYRSISIDVGSKKGLIPGMSVIAVQDQKIGLVGVVEEVYTNSSKVHLIVDPEKNSAASAQVMSRPISSTEEVIWYQGIVEGSSKHQAQLEMIYITHEADIIVGAPVRSTGLGGYYVGDLPIGTVSSLEVDAFGLQKRAIIKPYIDFSRIKEVLVITKPLPIKIEGN